MEQKKPSALVASGELHDIGTKYLVDSLAYSLAVFLGIEDVGDFLKTTSYFFVNIDTGWSSVLFAGSEAVSYGAGSSAPHNFDQIADLPIEDIADQESLTIYKRFASREYMKKLWDEGTPYAHYDFPLLINGEYRWRHASYVIKEVEELDNNRCAFIVVYDEDAYVRSQDAVKRAASTDALTGLLNRATLENSMRAYLKRPDFEPIALITCDVDTFKDVNDTWGHAAGDQALVAVAERLERTFYRRGKDSVYRWGGDEFLATMQDVTSEEVEAALNELTIEPIKVTTEEGDEFEITLSAGYAIAPAQATTYNDLFAVADAALYKAKEGGRHGWHA